MSLTRIPISKIAVDECNRRERLKMNVAELRLAVRITNRLEEHGIFTVADLLDRCPEDLLRISNFGAKTLDAIYLALADFGFHRMNASPVVPPRSQLRRSSPL